ncbi:MAG: hypothetical protein LBR26_11735 [Prevotella sp.]|nr:hypothetical protein [Prevotella sp.]
MNEELRIKNEELRMKNGELRIKNGVCRRDSLFIDIIEQRFGSADFGSADFQFNSFISHA